MTLEEKIATIRNVISDLEAYLPVLEGEAVWKEPRLHTIDDVWSDCKSACEYITTDTAHLYSLFPKGDSQ